MALAVAALLAPLSSWFVTVQHEVGQPYLDEVFHVRQAQHYCNARFDIWDPKITTPPGLYLLSYVFSPLLGCSISSLRLINAVCLLFLMLMIGATYHVRRKANDETGRVSRILIYHSALNAALFPPLFFFSALYYTDVPSTLSVTVFYWYFLRCLQEQSTAAGGFIQVALGAVSLMFRQTNIFWVAVAPAALTVIIELDRGLRVVRESMYRRAQGFGDSTLSVAKTSWKMDVLYDPPVRDAFFEDYIRTIVSLLVCGVKILTQPQRMLAMIRNLAPYLTLLALFGSFILWNGGVVLGDKSNHVATIHLSQMLYLWPFLAFFGWPLLLPHLVLVPMVVLSRIARTTALEQLLIFRRQSFLPRLWLLIAWTLLACLVVHFNTIVHPFTLADNRHYNFYMFRLLLRPRWMRYLVTPIYVLCGWACIDARGDPPNTSLVLAEKDVSAKQELAAGKSSDDPLKANAVGDAEYASNRKLRIPDGKSTAMVSFIMVWLATTALSLCTAPLVEPRYCILPFIIWRMHLPMHSPNNRHPGSKEKTLREMMQNYDYRIVLETVWFLAINAATGYIFLNRKFSWPSEPENVQRFMW
ncbi:glycosyltransferase family 59 [Lecanosticta acicola]|uniref:Dol-P-Glc:Glc(2)Man(9)GlcNAc(2)-PP-Dol alpha-1,2-glucosyltransferase n=1 Tax=Lecanosticta acicola TaxID=111012 RepID=A0AAI8YYM5_9PEZI|nr:glycosyltransferase family 59 [Lecanosticta acicola]